MKHAQQILNYEKRKLINRLYEMQSENDLGQAKHTDDDFQAIKRKVSQTDDAIKLIDSSVKPTKASSTTSSKGGRVSPANRRD